MPNSTDINISPARLHYEKLKLALRYSLQGRASQNVNWMLTLDALEFAEHHHPGLRKDGKTPSYQHQVEIALYLLSLSRDLRDAPRTIAAVLLHDVREDADISTEEIRDRFGKKLEHSVELLTKEFRGVKKTPEEYFTPLAHDYIASPAKGGDRVHNQRTMPGVFKFEKQVEYATETRTHFFKFLKDARRRFPDQEPVYENIKFVLSTQLAIFDSIHAQGFAA